MARLTTHVLDTAHGRPGAGMTVDLYALGTEPRLVASIVTNKDGRGDAPFGHEGEVAPGIYQMVFHVGDYFRRCGAPLPDPPFFDEVPLRFGIAEAAAHYHVPLLVSPWAYSTYRGN